MAPQAKGRTQTADIGNSIANDFAEKGYAVLPQFVPADQRKRLLAWVNAALQPLQGPVEYETEVGYAGSPANRDAPGGNTPRRLLAAYSRHRLLQNLATSEALAQALAAITGTDMALSQCHHNCIMTKCPGYSSTTLWHQDIRYWSFDRPELISAWFALTDETQANGALRLIPASHKLELAPEQFDAEQFLRPELPLNKALIASAEEVELKAGDLLLFHSRTFHAAGKNTTSEKKLSAVFTYHALDNRPVAGSRSAQLPSIELANPPLDPVADSQSF